MLEELHVRDIALIEEAWLEFGPGMTVLTGETGAGKTALLGALKLLLGERADSGAVRPGADETLVEGRFCDGETEIVVSRRVSAEGRSRAKLDGGMATVGELAERLGPLVDLHGQHEHQALLSPATHLGYLDRWAGTDVARALAAYRDSRSAHTDAVRAREEVAARIAQATTRADYLRFVADEISRVDPREGEDDALEARLPALRSADGLLARTHAAVESLRGEGGALDVLGEAKAELDHMSGVDRALDELRDTLGEVEVALDDVSQGLRGYRDTIEHDPTVLEAAENRLAELVALRKKYGPALGDVIAQRNEALAVLEAASDSEAALEEADAHVRACADALRGAAAELAALRESAVPGFVEALTEAVGDLAMQGARFEIALEELPFERWGPDGSERAEFLYASAPASPARPLARVASGGELSRVMLALKGVLGAADDVPVLVFDEVDAGIGGATATTVGRRLAGLAESHQVIVVTHLAQVAAFADTHLVVERRIEAGAASTSVRTVDAEERVSEIARMLSGSDSEASFAHAAELLEAAGRTSASLSDDTRPLAAEGA